MVRVGRSTNAPESASPRNSVRALRSSLRAAESNTMLTSHPPPTHPLAPTRLAAVDSQSEPSQRPLPFQTSRRSAVVPFSSSERHFLQSPYSVVRLRTKPPTYPARAERGKPPAPAVQITAAAVGFEAFRAVRVPVACISLARRNVSVSNKRRLGSSPHPRCSSRPWRQSPVAGRSPAPVPPSLEQLQRLPIRPIQHVRHAIRGALDPPAIGVAIHGIVNMSDPPPPALGCVLSMHGGEPCLALSIDAPRQIRLDRFVEAPPTDRRRWPGFGPSHPFRPAAP